MGKDLNGKELESGIYQRKDRIYVANVRCGGRTKSLYDTDPDNLKKRQAIFAKTKSGREKKITVDQLYQRFREERMGSITVGTQQTNDFQYAVLEQKIGKRIAIELTQMELQGLFFQLGKERYAASTLKNLLSLLNRMFQMAIRLNVMESNPARNIDLNGCSNKKPKDKFYLGDELLPGFLASCVERQYGDLYRFVLHTGMTFTETVKLCWEEVDLDRGSIAVVGRTRIQRRIPLDEEAKQILMERKKSAAWDNDFVFTSRSGSPITQQYVAKELQKLSEKLIPLENPHKITGGVLRNTFLYRKCELEGVSLSVVANAMGTNAETCLENIEELVELRKQYIN